jgi:hypothetical protein
VYLCHCFFVILKENKIRYLKQFQGRRNLNSTIVKAADNYWCVVLPTDPSSLYEWIEFVASVWIQGRRPPLDSNNFAFVVVERFVCALNAVPSMYFVF